MSDEHRDRQASEVPVGSIPRGVEILIQKAAVDPEFKALLLEKRSAAAAEVELTLSPAEAEMLDTVPAVQLKAIINTTKVPENTRRSLLGTVGLATLAALGVVSVCAPSMGHRIDRPKSMGIQPDVPPKDGAETPPESQPTEVEDNRPKPQPAPTGIRPDKPSGSR